MARPEPKVRLIAVDDTRATKKLKTAEPDPVEDIRSAQKDYISADDISASALPRPRTAAGALAPQNTAPPSSSTMPRCLGVYPVGNMQHKYIKEASLLSFVLDSENRLKAGRDLADDYPLGSISGYAYSFDNGEYGILELNHNVFVSQQGCTGNLLRHIGYTDNSDLANVSLHGNGFVCTTKHVKENELLLYEIKMPLKSVTMSSVAHEHWLRKISCDAFNSCEWFRIPYALDNMPTFTTMKLPTTAKTTITLVPATQALTWKLLLKYENVSKDRVAAVIIGDFRLMLAPGNYHDTRICCLIHTCS